jgi:hypothetical protein
LIATARAGQTHVLAGNGYVVRSYVRQARAEPGALEDGERAVELARRVGDAQVVMPALSYHARALAIEGDRTAARRLLQEVIDLCAKLPTMPEAWAAPVVWAFAEVGEPGEYLALLERVDRAGPWLDAARAAGEGGFARAAEIYAGMGALTAEAEARVHAAAGLVELGDRAGSEAQLAQATAFYRSVGASRLIRDAEALLAATA